MATATAQHDDDLLIISDDSENDSSGEIEFSFDSLWEEASQKAEVKKEEKMDIISEDILEIDTATPDKTEVEAVENTPVVESPVIQDETEASIDLNFGDITSEETTITTPEVSNPEEVTEDFSFNVLDDTPEVSNPEEVVAEKQETPKAVTVATPVPEVAMQEEDWAESLNDILGGTITKLKARKEVIKSQKSTKAKKEAEIKKEIENLQEQVVSLEWEIKALNQEDNKINSNISSLEQMKLNPVQQHNAKRISKK